MRRPDGGKELAIRLDKGNGAQSRGIFFSFNEATTSFTTRKHATNLKMQAKHNSENAEKKTDLSNLSVSGLMKTRLPTIPTQKTTNKVIGVEETAQSFRFDSSRSPK